MERQYKILTQQVFVKSEYSIVPIRHGDRHLIRQWRNEQIYHLRQTKPLTKEDQNTYFETVVAALFDDPKPTQVLFSYLHGDQCIGYGGLVHINWRDKHAEISFVMDTSLEEKYFEFHWTQYLGLIEKVAFEELGFNKIFTYAYDLRPRLYEALKAAGFWEDARLTDHCLFDGEFRDVLIHSKLKSPNQMTFRYARLSDAKLLFDWVNEQAVRRNSISSEPIAWENHLTWLRNRIDSGDCLIYIFSKQGNEVGQVRLEKSEFWYIDYSVDQNYRGKGIGTEMLKQVLLSNREKPLLAYVKPDNIGSNSVFKKLGFSFREKTEKNGVDLNVFVKNPE